jgi:hypothetical protein
MMLPKAGISRAMAVFSARPVCVWYCPTKWMSSFARMDRTRPILSM